VIVWHGYPPAAGASGGLGALPPSEAPTGHPAPGPEPPHHLFSGGGLPGVLGPAGAPQPPRNGGGGGAGSSASSVSMRSADLAVSAAGPGHHYHAGRDAAGAAGGVGGYGSGISTPLDSASTRTTPPKEQGQHGGLRGAEWDLGAAPPAAPAADARVHRAPLAPVGAAENARHGGGGAPAAYPSHGHAGGRLPAACDETDATYTADVPLAGGIKYLAGVRPRAPQQQQWLQPQRAVGGHGSEAPAPASPPQAPGGSGPEAPASAPRAVTFAGGVSAVEAPTATDHLPPHRGQTPPQPQARTVEVATFGAPAALAGPPARTMRFHGRRK
jgi:hypothetical protein